MLADRRHYRCAALIEVDQTNVGLHSSIPTSLNPTALAGEFRYVY